MRVFIDSDGTEEITEFVYTNGDGAVEGVKEGDSNRYVYVFDSADEVCIFMKDIPKLIAALQAAQKEWGNTDG